MTPELRAFTGGEHQPYFLQGSDESVALLVHGFPGTPAELRPVGGMIHRAGLSVSGMLLPGFGSDFLNVANYRNEEWLAAVEDELVMLRSRFARILLVGNSMGSALAMQAATRQPVDGLLLFSPWWRIEQRWLDALAPLVQPLIPRLHPFRRADFADARLRTALLRFMPDVNLDDAEAQEAIRNLQIETSVITAVRRTGRLAAAAAPLVTTPTLIIQAVNDILVRPAVTATLARRLPNLAGLAIADGDHEIAHMEQPNAQALEPLIAHFAQLITFDNAAVDHHLAHAADA